MSFLLWMQDFFKPLGTNYQRAVALDLTSDCSSTYILSAPNTEFANSAGGDSHLLARCLESRFCPLGHCSCSGFTRVCKLGMHTKEQSRTEAVIKGSMPNWRSIVASTARHLLLVLPQWYSKPGQLPPTSSSLLQYSISSRLTFSAALALFSSAATP